MEAFMLAYEEQIRLAVFFGALVAVGLVEMAAPRRKLSEKKLVRWTNNLGIVLLYTVLLRLIFPVLAVSMAQLSARNGWGFLNMVDLPLWLEVLVAVVILDLLIYLQHVMFHAIPALWRLHRMHHADLDYDVTTGLRFHPIEIILSMGIKLAAVALIGPSAIAVFLFEMLLNGMAMFNHGNFRLPIWLDNTLRWVVVTPDMHRVHHSVSPSEANTNFGFNLSWWDRLLGTYLPQPRDGHTGMTIGLGMFRESRELWLDRLLTQPFRKGGRDYAINREAK